MLCSYYSKPLVRNTNDLPTKTYLDSLAISHTIESDYLWDADMFLVGTAMLTFAMALHVMFVGQRNSNGKGSHHSGSAFNLEV